MNFGRQFAVFFLLLVLLLTSSCTKKKPQIPPQAKAPAEPIPVALPPEISETTPPPPAPPRKQETIAQEAPKPKPNTRRRKKTVQPPANAQSGAPASANSGNTTVAAARPPANPAETAPADVAISAGASGAQLTQQKQNTTQLLDLTEKTLNELNHNLTHEQEEIVAQIKSYVAQSRKATQEGDFERAYNLATKAHLLSDALVSK